MPKSPDATPAAKPSVPSAAAPADFVNPLLRSFPIFFGVFLFMYFFPTPFIPLPTPEIVVFGAFDGVAHVAGVPPVKLLPDNGVVNGGLVPGVCAGPKGCPLYGCGPCIGGGFAPPVGAPPPEYPPPSG